MILNVRQMSDAERKALELVLGQALRDDDRVTIDVAQAPAATSKEIPHAQTEEEVPDSWNVYRGLSDAEIDEIEASFQRLDFGRRTSE